MIECKEKLEILKKLNFLKQPSNTPIIGQYLSTLTESIHIFLKKWAAFR